MALESVQPYCEPSIETVLEHLRQQRGREAEVALAQLSLCLCDGVTQGSITPQVADATMTSLLVRLEEEFPDVALSESVTELLFEGQLFHDYGKEHGVDMSRLRELALSVAPIAEVHYNKGRRLSP